MKEIFEQYGGPIITVIAIVAIAAIVTVILISSNTEGSGGVVQTKFEELVNGFFDKADGIAS